MTKPVAYTTEPGYIKNRVRLIIGDDIAFGPGKADLLDAIKETGSISAAARSMNMSYRRAWLLVDTMNTYFEHPLVETASGGHKGGGASLTQTGIRILQRYRSLEKQLQAVCQKQEQDFLKELKPAYR